MILLATEMSPGWSRPSRESRTGALRPIGAVLAEALGRYQTNQHSILCENDARFCEEYNSSAFQQRLPVRCV